MKERVKEWIADKNLTIDSFDNIMIGVIYNSYHNMLDDPDVRKWIGMNPSEFREMLPPNLNEKQKIVLEWLKNEYTGDADPFGILAFLFSQAPKSEVTIASLELTRAEQAQLLQAFSQWVLEQEEE